MTTFSTGPIRLGIAVILIISGLNYTGFCWQEFRFLSDGEKIERAIRVLLNEWNGSVESINKNAASTMPSRRFAKIADVTEFKRLNPDCCKIYTHYNSFAGRTAETMAMSHDSYGLGQQVPLLAKLTGCTFGYVEIKWRVPIYSNGVLAFGPIVDHGTRVSNCGETSTPINYLK